MTATADWLTAFPLQPATAAVDALLQGWADLSVRELPDFNPKTKEAKLTKKLKVYVENYVARERGLLGMWAAENVIGEIDPATGDWIEERRTDIVYGWNDETREIKLVFEFKRLGRQKKHRDHYLQNRGLGRFVTGIYSRDQAVAAMVGVLLDPESEVVPPIRQALDDAALAADLRLKPTASGKSITRPSQIFGTADFDTEHERDPTLAPKYGTIRVSHFFLSFGYPVSTSKQKKTS